MKAIEALTTLALLGSGQWNLFTAQQALESGVSRNRLSRFSTAGTIYRVRNGVYALPSADFGPLQELRAAWLSTDPQRPAGSRTHLPDPIAVSGISAAQVHGIGEIIPSKHEFVSPSRRQSSQPDVRFRRGSIAKDDWEVLDGLPVTSVVRTVSDVAKEHADYDHLRGIVQDALEKPAVSAPALVHALDPYAHRYGTSSGEALFSEMVSSSPSTAKASSLLRAFLTPELRDTIERTRKANFARVPIPGNLSRSFREVSLAGSELSSQFTKSQFETIRAMSAAAMELNQHSELISNLLALTQSRTQDFLNEGNSPNDDTAASSSAAPVARDEAPQ